jgi:hypothetical protein
LVASDRHGIPLWWAIAALCLATTVLIVGRLIDYRNRWSPN